MCWLASIHVTIKLSAVGAQPELIVISANTYEDCDGPVLRNEPRYCTSCEYHERKDRQPIADEPRQSLHSFASGTINGVAKGFDASQDRAAYFRNA
jgi:hypothetical protein